MNDGEDREAALETLAAKLYFRLEKAGSRYSLYRDVDVREPVRREGLTLGEAEELLGTWKLRGEHGG
jgi:hypothetical protein